MVKVMAINAGSSSLKFQLINMPSEEVITSGLVERIGLDQGNFEMKYNGEKFIKECPIKDHSVAVQLLLDALVDHHVVESLGEIEACGHRVVHGGEYYNLSLIHIFFYVAFLYLLVLFMNIWGIINLVI